MKYAAVITCSDEDASLAVVSARSDKRIHWIIFETPDAKLPLLSEEAERLLNKEHTLCVPPGAAESLIPEGCEAFVYLHPNCSVGQAGLDRLFSHVDFGLKEHRYTHYCMSSQVCPPPASIYNLFFIIIFLIDAYWARFMLFNSPRHPLDRHIRVILVLTIGNRRFLATKRWYWRFWNSDECPNIDGGALASIKTDESGWSFLVHSIKRHPYLLSFGSPLGLIWLLCWWFSAILVGLWLVGNTNPVLWVSIMIGLGCFASIPLSPPRGDLKLDFLALHCLIWPVPFALLPILTLIIKLFF